MNKTYFGSDCRTTLKNLTAQGVKAQMCVTSPPYYGLRDYGFAGQIGLEKSPSEYVATMVEVFECVRELLSDDGVLWLNLGDSYAANRTYQVPSTKGGNKHSTSQACNGKGSTVPEGLKPKDLIGIPWRVAFALQEAGWYLRQDIIWHKPNPMPESVKDRCTKAHEYLFLLSKSERYYFDSDAMKEPVQSNKGNGKSFRGGGSYVGGNSFNNHQLKERETHGNATNESGQRNRRSVWTVASKPYSGAHFATFPPALIEPCILAGSRPGDLVLDPFMGSGTTAQVAQTLDRRWLGCELNPNYETLQIDRFAKVGLK